MTTAQDQQSRELPPCPFCGKGAHFEHDADGWQWVACESCGMESNRRASLMDDCKPLLAEAWNRRVPASIERTYICPTRTVADLVSNLLLLDQALPIYGTQYIEHPHGKRRAITVPPTVSRERVKDGRWIGEGDELNAAVIWTRAEQPGAQERKPLTPEELSAVYLAWQRTDMTSIADFARAIESSHGIKASP